MVAESRPRQMAIARQPVRLHFPDSPLGGLRIPSSPLIALRHPGGCFARVANPIAKFFIRDLVSRKTGLTL